MKGKLYGVGVGPGDPELLTLKAARIIRECDLIAVPDSRTSEQTALQIARQAIGSKRVLSLHLPMTRNPSELSEHREQAASQLCAELDRGNSVAFLTLGDPTIYSTYAYLHQLVQQRGFEAEIIPGIPSFCAAAAALGTPLCVAGQPLHILPASYPGAEQSLELEGNKVLMKSGKSLGALCKTLAQKGMLGRAMLAERVSMDGERLVRHLSEDENSGYFSVVIVKEEDA